MMKLSLVIGAYKLHDFVRLNLCQCRTLFGDDIPILVSDDRSPVSDLIAEAANDYDASYICGEKRMSHFTGDLQHLLCAAKWGELTESDVCIKLSQRFVPLVPEFVTTLTEPFNDPTVAMVVPGQPKKRQMARPGSAFYAGFGLLTDCVAWRPGALSSETIEKFYRDQLADVTDTMKGKHLVEVTIGRIAAKLLAGRVRMLDALANHQIGKPKMYLRKAQSNRGEYAKLAETLGLSGEFDVREWAAIEGKDYLPMGPVI